MASDVGVSFDGDYGRNCIAMMPNGFSLHAKAHMGWRTVQRQGIPTPSSVAHLEERDRLTTVQQAVDCCTSDCGARMLTLVGRVGTHRERIRVTVRFVDGCGLSGEVVITSA